MIFDEFFEMRIMIANKANSVFLSTLRFDEFKKKVIYNTVTHNKPGFYCLVFKRGRFKSGSKIQENPRMNEMFKMVKNLMCASSDSIFALRTELKKQI